MIIALRQREREEIDRQCLIIQSLHSAIFITRGKKKTAHRNIQSNNVYDGIQLRELLDVVA